MVPPAPTTAPTTATAAAPVAAIPPADPVAAPLAEGEGEHGASRDRQLHLSGAELTLLYDGGCPLCLREVRVLRSRDGGRGRLAFVDIDEADYDPAAYAGISYREAMGRIHAIAADGSVLRDLAVFRRAYALVDLGWLYAPTRWPLLAPLADAAYGFWASRRLRWTGRADLETLCRCRPR